jgi:homoserine/homoserine lactone efflux protein
VTAAVDGPTLLAFALAASAIVVSPGPDTFLILRAALTSGARAGIAAVTGVQLGLVVHTLLAAAGITALVAASPPLFAAVAIVGASYLAWLGWQGVRARGRLMLGAAPPRSPRLCLCEAMLTNLLNPKVLVLFFALYPNFIDASAGAVSRQIALLSALLIAINTGWQTGLVWFAERARRWLGDGRAQRLLSRVTGIILIGFAVAMLIEHVA